GLLRLRRPSISAPRPEASLAIFELPQRGLESLAGEVRPQLVAEDELRVGALPQQVVRDSLLAARAYQKVWVVHLGRVEVAAEILLGAATEGSRRVQDLRSAAVVEGDEERDPAVLARRLLRPVHPLAQLGGDSLAATDEA